jgi:hypothetical protein|tara:strand:- start:99 stop:455 length:357 start_codon:yes stop_codon:yes gene_type:complete
MKITRRHLRRVIREAMVTAGTPFSRNPDPAFQPLKSFKIPYKNYGYEGRPIITRDRAWLEFVPKGSPPMTKEDMFRAVTLLDSDDPEIGLAMATVHAPKSAGPVENYDVYSVYATTTG